MKIKRCKYRLLEDEGSKNPQDNIVFNPEYRYYLKKLKAVISKIKVIEGKKLSDLTGSDLKNLKNLELEFKDILNKLKEIKELSNREKENLKNIENLGNLISKANNLLSELHDLTIKWDNEKASDNTEEAEKYKKLIDQKTSEFYSEVLNNLDNLNIPNDENVNWADLIKNIKDVFSDLIQIDEDKDTDPEEIKRINKLVKDYDQTDSPEGKLYTIKYAFDKGKHNSLEKLLKLFNINFNISKLNRKSNESLILSEAPNKDTIKKVFNKVSGGIFGKGSIDNEEIAPLDNWVQAMSLKEIMNPNNGFMAMLEDEDDYFRVLENRDNFFKIYNAYVDTGFDKEDVEKLKETDNNRINILSDAGIINKSNRATISKLYKTYLDLIDNKASREEIARTLLDKNSNGGYIRKLKPDFSSDENNNISRNEVKKELTKVGDHKNFDNKKNIKGYFNDFSTDSLKDTISALTDLLKDKENNANNNI